jgi:hypothetical protein
MSADFPPEDWPFTTLKLGEYFALSRQVARHVRESQCEIAEAVSEILGDRTVSDREREMIRQNAISILVLGLEDDGPH